MMSLRLLMLPVVAGAIVAAAAGLPGAEPESRTPRSVIVAQSSYACPTENGTTVVAGRFAAHAGARATAVALPGRKAVEALTPVDSWNDYNADAQTVLVSTSDAKGAGAVGFFGGIASAKDGGGFGVGACPGVVQDSWYLGVGSGAKHFSTVTLTNLSDSPAIADVSLWGLKGIVETVDAEGIVLDSFETRRISLDSLAAGEPEMAMRVHSRRGALSVAVRDTSTAVFGGTEPLAQTAAPARRHVIAGIAAGAGGRQLVALNPGDSTARVKIEALGKGGVFVPTGLDDVKILAGRVKVIDLPKFVGEDAVALRLTSDQPLSGSVRMAPTNKDFAYAVAGRPLDGPAIVPLSIGDLLTGARLLLTAPGARAHVTVTAFDATMAKQGSVELTVKPGSTLSYDLGKKGSFDKPLADLAYVVVATAGRLQGAALYERRDGISAVPLTAAPLKTPAPHVRPGR